MTIEISQWQRIQITPSIAIHLSGFLKYFPSLSDESLGLEKPMASASSTTNSGSTTTATNGSACAAGQHEALLLRQQDPPDPVVMPGFPVRTLQAHPPPPYSPSR